MDKDSNSGIYSGEVTKIEKQKKNKTRYSIFIDDVYAFSLDSEVLLQINLSVGQTLSGKEVSECLNINEQKRCKIKAFNFLARRDHSEKELKDKLNRYNFPAAVIKSVLSDLKSKNFLNDKNFSEIFAKNLLNQRPVGKRKIAAELEQRGISELLMEAAVEKVYAEFDEVELARLLVQKKIKTLSGQPEIKKRKKLGDFLFRRGFDWDIVQQTLSETDLSEESNAN